MCCLHRRPINSWFIVGQRSDVLHVLGYGVSPTSSPTSFISSGPTPSPTNPTQLPTKNPTATPTVAPTFAPSSKHFKTIAIYEVINVLKN